MVPHAETTFPLMFKVNNQERKKGSLIAHSFTATFLFLDP